MLACQDRESEAGGEKSRRQDGGGLGQRIAGAAAGHKAAAAADAERAPFGALQQNDANQRQGNHNVNQQKDSAHLVALVFEGVVLSESATVWLGLLSAVSDGSRTGFRSGSGTASVSAGGAGAATAFLSTPPPRQRDAICASTSRNFRTCSSSWSFRCSLTQSGPRSSAACMLGVSSFLRSLARLAQLALSSGYGGALPRG